MARIHLKYVQTTLKEREVYFYFRRRGYPRIRLPGYPGSKEFMAAYQKALATEREQVGASRTLPRSMKALAIAWRASSQFKGLTAASQKTYNRLIENFLERHGHKAAATAEPRHILAILESMSDTPAQANALRNVLRQMFQYAFEHGWRQDNPVKDIKKLKYRKNPFPTWSEEDIRIFENFWPIGSRARLALALFLYTGQRRSDVIRMGPKHVSNGGIDVVQLKTGKQLHIPMHSELREVLEKHPVTGEAFLMTQQGRPFASGNAF